MENLTFLYEIFFVIFKTQRLLIDKEINFSARAEKRRK